LTGWHLPRASGLAQKVHLPVQALSQQTPSTQKLEAHWLLAVQSWPSPLGPQLPFTQALGGMHLSLPVQLLRQAPASQVEGAQESATPCTQVPSPSQRPAGVNLSLPSQLASLQTVPAENFAQPPCPLQKPL
jgi:hypothetical protein